MGEAAEDQTLIQDTEQLEPPQSPQKMSLREIRKDLGRTQVQVASKAGMSQGDLSRLERRSDHLLSTLERYAAALGGELDIAVVRGTRRYPLDF